VAGKAVPTGTPITVLIMFTRALTLLAATALAHAAPAEHVILVSIDGWAHHYFDDPKCHMPTVKALAANGVRAKRMECSFPTVTWTNHTTLVTGVHPGRHGVLANAYFDRATAEKGAAHP
jgi:predicted AlkP superfamily pyrophosphatase or phosphodiesterase